ncbi:MAG: transposase, partial [Lachnospiraceae bacterium]|nr:transposase [Lachnospiraceae bacterium]
MAPTKPVISIPVPDDILTDPDYYLTGKMITKQVCDIELSVSVTEYSTPEYRSHSTGKRGHAPFPNALANEFNYGPNAKALAFLLNNHCNVSIDKTQELIKNLSNGSIILSRGLINDLSRQFSANTEEERQRIFDRLLMAPVMYSDATPGRVNGKTVQVIICANEDEMLYSFREHKGHEGIKGTPVETYQQILVHDHDKTYYHYGSEHQECLAHVLRYLQDSIDNEPELTWNLKMQNFLSSLIHSYKTAKDAFTEEYISVKEQEYSRIISLAETEYLKHPPKKYYRDGFNLYKRMDQYKTNHLLFLRHPEIDYTNNLSERSLRKFKCKQQQAVTFRNHKSVELLCNCM